MKLRMYKRMNSLDDGVSVSAFVFLTVALLHPIGKSGGPDSAVAGETLEDIQSLWDIRDGARSWGGWPRTRSVQQFTCFPVQ
jgi:hypothetical protein